MSDVPTHPPRELSRRALIGALTAGIVTCAGVLVLLRPLVARGDGWAWHPMRSSDLNGIKINADVISVFPSGVVLHRQGSRPISVITPPLHLAPTSLPVVRIRAALPEESSTSQVETAVRLLWQTEQAESYQFDTQRVSLSRDFRDVDFSLRVAPDEVYRLGLQFPDGPDRLRIESISFPDLTLRQRWLLGNNQIAQHEPIANHSVNFLRGPSILGHGLNYYLVGVMMTAVGLYSISRLTKGERLRLRVPLAVVFIAWLIVDVQWTVNLGRQTIQDVKTFRDRSWTEQIAAMNGPSIAWAYEQLVAACPEGGTYAVISDDSFTPAHRLDYLLAPARTRSDHVSDCGYIIVIDSAKANFDAAAGVLAFPNGSVCKATRVVAFSPTVYLLKVSR